MRTIIASKFILNLPWWWPPCVLLSRQDNGLQVYLGVHLITCSKCISILTHPLPWSVSPNLLCHGVLKQWGYKPESIVSPVDRTSCNIEREFVRQIRFRWWLWTATWLWGIALVAWIYEGSARFSDDAHKLCGSINAQQECMGPSAGKDRVYNV